jgi:hypothetical protein
MPADPRTTEDHCRKCGEPSDLSATGKGAVVSGYHGVCEPRTTEEAPLTDDALRAIEEGVLSDAELDTFDAYINAYYGGQAATEMRLIAGILRSLIGSVPRLTAEVRRGREEIAELRKLLGEACDLMTDTGWVVATNSLADWENHHQAARRALGGGDK